ncbi:galactoside-binding lectin, partial [Ancylostoma caninum]
PKPIGEFANEVFSPSVPVEIPVTEFTDVRRIRILLQPVLTRGGTKFYVNFKNGEDIVMQMNPRIHHKAIVFNTFYNGHWQAEETVPMICPIEANGTYTLEFVPSRSHSVFFYIDGRFTHEFRERQPGFKVRSVEIGGHVEVISVHLS